MAGNTLTQTGGPTKTLPASHQYQELVFHRNPKQANKQAKTGTDSQIQETNCIQDTEGDRMMGEIGKGD